MKRIARRRNSRRVGPSRPFVPRGLPERRAASDPEVAETLPRMRRIDIAALERAAR